MNATFSARFPFEVLDHISDIRLRPIDAGFGQCIIKQTPGGADKRFARQIFFVAGLFTDKEDFGATGSFAKNCLCAALPKIAGFAIGRGVAKSRQCFSLREKIHCGAFGFRLRHDLLLGEFVL